MALFKRGKIWWMAYTADGRQVRKSTGQTNRKKAEDVWVQTKVALTTGTYVPEAKRTSLPAVPPFEIALDAYLDHRKAEGKQGTSYERLERYWKPKLAGRQLDAITTEEIEAALKDWTDTHKWTSATRNNALNQLSGFFSYCYGRRWIDRHPTEKGRVPKLAVDNARTRWLRPHEIESIRAKVVEIVHADDQTRDPEKRSQRVAFKTTLLRDIIDFACATGLRHGRICELRQADFETDEAGNAYVFIARDKNGERLFKALFGPIRAMVERRVAEAPFAGSYLFAGPGGGCADMFIKRTLRRVVESAGIKWGRSRDGVTFHTFRHSMASNALNAGIPEHIVQQMGNWKDRRMLARYAHLANERLREAEARLADIIVGRSGEVLSRIITAPRNAATAPKKGRSQVVPGVLVTGGADGTRTRDLRSDSPVC